MNEELLKLFEEDMKDLSPRTTWTHLDNIDFYINQYLPRDEPLTFIDGIREVNWFLEVHYVKKCFVTEGTLKELEPASRNSISV